MLLVIMSRTQITFTTTRVIPSLVVAGECTKTKAFNKRITQLIKVMGRFFLTEDEGKTIRFRWNFIYTGE